MLKGWIETEDRKESEGKGDYKTAGCTKGPNQLLSAAQKEHKNISDAISTILHSVLKLCLVCQPAFFIDFCFAFNTTHSHGDPRKTRGISLCFQCGSLNKHKKRKTNKI